MSIVYIGSMLIHTYKCTHKRTRIHTHTSNDIGWFESAVSVHNHFQCTLFIKLLFSILHMEEMEVSDLYCHKQSCITRLLSQLIARSIWIECSCHANFILFSIRLFVCSVFPMVMRLIECSKKPKSYRFQLGFFFIARRFFTL